MSIKVVDTSNPNGLPSSKEKNSRWWDLTVDNNLSFSNYSSILTTAFPILSFTQGAYAEQQFNLTWKWNSVGTTATPTIHLVRVGRMCTMMIPSFGPGIDVPAAQDTIVTTTALPANFRPFSASGTTGTIRIKFGAGAAAINRNGMFSIANTGLMTISFQANEYTPTGAGTAANFVGDCVSFILN